MLHRSISRYPALLAAFFLVVGLSLSACDSAALSGASAAEGPGAEASTTVVISGPSTVGVGCTVTFYGQYDPPSLPGPSGYNWTLTSNTNEATIVSQTGSSVKVKGLAAGHVVLNYFGPWGRVAKNVTVGGVCEVLD